MDLNSRFEIDNTTWNDLSLEDVYSRLNYCDTSAGEYFLRDRLKRPYIKKCEEYDSFINLTDEAAIFRNNKSLKDALLYISKLKKYNFVDEIMSIKDEEQGNNLKHIIIDAFIIISFIMIFIFPGPGIVAFFGFIAYSVSDYFKTKNIIAGHLTVFNYLIRMLKSLRKYRVCEITDITEYNNKLKQLKEIINIYKPFIRGTYIISESAKTTSNPLSILFDYIRMIFHVDIIKYNSMISFVINNREDAIKFYNIIGELDTAICISSIKDDLLCKKLKLCKPDISNNKHFELVDGYHLLLDSPVINSINTDKNILITGCNASGKSTFLKMIAVNIIFAQSFGFVFASTYKACFFRIYSSMALKDDINKGESYFIAEIKSLKRIVDACSTSDNSIPVFCVIDEVLRGTNTVERIAASTEILLNLKTDNSLCFAATHDIELTELLKESYDNYHFSEKISGDDVEFDFKIKEGPANSRNAIRLLKALGYDEKIVLNASKRVDSFLESGEYTV
ncbi:MAG: hypothetical protein Q4D29_06395 [Lachnospiraceae bacterium]|nr:hypothetical protein [Lachnospiraceae bacterium]